MGYTVEYNIERVLESGLEILLYMANRNKPGVRNRTGRACSKPTSVGLIKYAKTRKIQIFKFEAGSQRKCDWVLHSIGFLISKRQKISDISNTASGILTVMRLN